MSSGNLFVLLGILVLLYRGFSDCVGFIMNYRGLREFINSPFSLSASFCETLLGGGGVLMVPCLNFKPLHVAISEGSHVAVGISSIATDMHPGPRGFLLYYLFSFIWEFATRSADQSAAALRADKKYKKQLPIKKKRKPLGPGY